MPSVEWNKQEWAAQLRDFDNFRLPYYGSQWGDPDPRAVFPYFVRAVMPEALAAALLQPRLLRRWLHRIFKPKAPFYPELYALIQKYIRPYVRSDSVVLEIGPGGGRWTRYLLNAKQIILVDIVSDFFEYLQQRFPDHAAKFTFYQPKAHDLHAIADRSVDYLLTFDAFVHIEPDGIREYLHEIARVLKPGAIAVIHYGDITKQAANEQGVHFAPMTGAKMQEFLTQLPQFKVLLHDQAFLKHSNLVVVSAQA